MRVGLHACGLACGLACGRAGKLMVAKVQSIIHHAQTILHAHIYTHFILDKAVLATWLKSEHCTRMVAKKMEKLGHTLAKEYKACKGI